VQRHRRGLPVHLGNLELLQIDPRFYLHVEHVRPSVRVGPDGIVVAETVAEYIQFLEGRPPG
jgi:hypothetical protein